MELLNTSVYDSPILMGALFFLGGIALFLIVAITPDDKKAPMHYFVAKTELPEDDTHEKASHFFWILLLMIIILYYIL